jgi:membrane protease YdiL (CAAX protease family)
VAASAALFAAAHLDPGSALPLLLLGALLGAATLRAGGNLVVPFVAHSLYNGAVLLGAVLLAPPAPPG